MTNAGFRVGRGGGTERCGGGESVLSSLTVFSCHMIEKSNEKFPAGLELFECCFSFSELILCQASNK